MTNKQKITLIIKLYKTQVRNKEWFLKAAGINFYMSESTIQQAWLSTGVIPEKKINTMLDFTLEYISGENEESEKLIKKHKS